MATIISGANAYYAELERFCKDNGIEPQITIACNMKGHIWMMANPNLTQMEKLKLIESAYKTMADIIMKEATGMKNAKTVDFKDLKKV